MSSMLALPPSPVTSHVLPVTDCLRRLEGVPGCKGQIGYMAFYRRTDKPVRSSVHALYFVATHSFNTHLWHLRILNSVHALLFDF